VKQQLAALYVIDGHQRRGFIDDFDSGTGRRSRDGLGVGTKHREGDQDDRQKPTDGGQFAGWHFVVSFLSKRRAWKGGFGETMETPMGPEQGKPIRIAAIL
jgi:hypothetical protein